MLMTTPCACGCGGVVTHPKRYKGYLALHPNRFLRGHHIRKRSQKMEANGRWKGGRFIDRDGYALVKCPDHPAARKKGYILEHRLVMEAHLGRPLLPSEIVHHKNSHKSDNRIDNLELLDGQATHMIVERTGRKFPRKNGIWFTCETCSQKFYRSACHKDTPVRFCSWSCRYPRLLAATEF